MGTRGEMGSGEITLDIKTFPATWPRQRVQEIGLPTFINMCKRLAG